MSTRKKELGEWVAATLNCAPVDLVAASSDASFRRYFRFRHGADSLIAMDAPPPQEDLGRFVRLAGDLARTGLNVPQVLHADLPRGFALVSDLGTDTFLAALAAQTPVDGPPPAPDWLTGERPQGNQHLLYPAAMQALVRLQGARRAQLSEVPDYDRALLTLELGIFEEWFLRAHLGIALRGPEREAWEAMCQLLIDSALVQPTVLVHRDYHSRNLMLSRPLPGVLDFQDAVWGPVTYDLVSLLRDCYISWPQAQVDSWLGSYFEQALLAGVPVGKPVVFRQWFDLMGLQRHLKAIGIFARLLHRDGRPGYLADIPRVLQYVQDVARQDARLTWLAGLIEHRVQPAMAEASR